MSVAVAAIAVKAALEVGQGFMARGAAKVQAQFAEVAARQRGIAALGAVESAIGSQQYEIQSSGFAGGGEAIARADRTRGAADYEAARFQGWAQSQRLKQQGRNAVIAGIAKGLGTAAALAAPGDPGGGPGPYGGGNSADGNWGR